jgi:hypothetical protein
MGNAGGRMANDSEQSVETLQVPELSEPDAPLIEAPSEPVVSESQELDYRTEYEKAEQKIQNLEHQVSSMQGSVRRRGEQDSRLDELVKSVRRMEPVTQLMREYISNPGIDPEDLMQKNQEIDARQAQVNARAEFDETFNDWSSRIQQKATDLKLDLTDPDLYKDATFSDAATAWNKSQEGIGDLKQLSRAAILFDTALENYQGTAKADDQQEEVREKVNQARRDGKMRVDQGRSSVSAGASDTDFADRMLDPNYLASPEDLKRMQKLLGN